MTKAREVETVLKNRGYEKGTRDLLIELYEWRAQVAHDIQEMVQTQLHSINMIGQVVDGASRLRTELERLQRRNNNDDDDLPPLAS